MNRPDDEAFVADPSETDPRRAGETWHEYRLRTGTKPGNNPATITNRQYIQELTKGS